MPAFPIVGDQLLICDPVGFEIPAGTTERGKRTIAKEKLFYHILGHIRNLKGYENFEIYCDTPAESAVDYWRHPYRHWQFLANEFRNQSGV